MDFFSPYHGSTVLFFERMKELFWNLDFSKKFPKIVTYLLIVICERGERGRGRVCLKS